MGIMNQILSSAVARASGGLFILVLLAGMAGGVQAADDGLSSLPSAVLEAVNKDKPGIILQSARQSSRDDGAHYLVKGVMYGKEIRFVVRYDGKIIYSVDVKR